MAISCNTKQFLVCVEFDERNLPSLFTGYFNINVGKWRYAFKG